MCLLYGSSTGPAGIGRHEDLGFFSETLVRLPRSGASSGGNQEFKCWVYRRTLRAVVILVFSGRGHEKGEIQYQRIVERLGSPVTPSSAAVDCCVWACASHHGLPTFWVWFRRRDARSTGLWLGFS